MLPSFITLSLQMRQRDFNLDLGFTKSTTSKGQQIIDDCLINAKESYGQGNPDWEVNLLWQRELETF